MKVSKTNVSSVCFKSLLLLLFKKGYTSTFADLLGSGRDYPMEDEIQSSKDSSSRGRSTVSTDMEALQLH